MLACQAWSCAWRGPWQERTPRQWPDPTASLVDRLNVGDALDVFERVATNHKQIGFFAGLQSADKWTDSTRLGRDPCGGFDRLQRRHAASDGQAQSVHHATELAIERTGIAADHQARQHTVGEQTAEDLQLAVVVRLEPVTPRIFGRRQAIVSSLLTKF